MMELCNSRPFFVFLDGVKIMAQLVLFKASINSNTSGNIGELGFNIFKTHSNKESEKNHDDAYMRLRPQKSTSSRHEMSLKR